MRRAGRRRRPRRRARRRRRRRSRRTRAASPATSAIARPSTALVESGEKEFGAVDILVNNAGLTRDNILLRLKDEDWDAVLDANLRGAFVAIARRRAA